MDSISAWGLEINPVVLLVVVFYVGVLVRMLARAGAAFRSEVNTYPTRRAWVKRNWDIFLARTFITTLFFTWWLFDPSALARFLVNWIHVPAEIGNWFVFPPTPLTAPVFGYGGDVGLDQIQFRLAKKYPWLPEIIKGEVPSYDSAVVKTEELDPKRKVGETKDDD